MDFLGKLSKAFEITEKNYDYINIERAIFLSYYCDLRDCKFCYMSTIKSSPKKGLRSIDSIYAEAFLVTMAGWNVEFLSSGYGAFDVDKIVEVTKGVATITGQPVWLNTGVLREDEISLFGEELKGITASIETFTEELFEKLCPSKKWDSLLDFLDSASSLGYKKGLTIILGIGEKKDDLYKLFQIIKDYKINRITFYSLNPHKGTIFENSTPPSSLYYLDIVSETRIAFPKLEIVTGIWSDKINLVGSLLMAGSNGITKFSWQKFYGSKLGKTLSSEIEEFQKLSRRRFNGSITDLSLLENKIEFPKNPLYSNEEVKKIIFEQSKQIRERINSYITEIQKNE